MRIQRRIYVKLHKITNTGGYRDYIHEATEENKYMRFLKNIHETKIQINKYMRLQKNKHI